MFIRLIIAILFLLIVFISIYYVSFAIDLHEEIKTKKEFFLSLIPFYLWYILIKKYLIEYFNNLK